jgi:RimJ/RimL family protein N-acetyltransferase
MIETDRLLLRMWESRDREPFARLNSDPRVMEFMPACLSHAESDLLADRLEAHFREYGFGLYAVEVREERLFIGFAGLAIPTFKAAFTPCVEIGWRLSANSWGRGFATEAATAVVRESFTSLGLDELVSFTVPANLRSRRVMEKIAMTCRPSDDFDHPILPEGHPLRRHVLYRLRRSDWANRIRPAS